MSGLQILRIGPSVTIQDRGRTGFIGQGISRGGAADTLALAEGAALLRQDAGLAALEMAGMGGVFEATGDLRFALTGAVMPAALDGEAIAWNASHSISAGQRLEIGSARRGVYGYLHLGGGVDIAPILGARATHLAAGLGTPFVVGDLIPAGSDKGQDVGLTFAPDNRFDGGTLRIVPSFQTDLFRGDVRGRFAATDFRRGPRANRMGVEMVSDGAGFAAAGQLNVLSEVIVPGDVQMTGDGKPFVMLREAQTTGGYPRIGTVLPSDLPKVAQAQAGQPFGFEWVTLEHALEIEARHAKFEKGLASACRPILRDPATMQDLLSYQLISGAVSASADPFDAGA